MFRKILSFAGFFGLLFSLSVGGSSGCTGSDVAQTATAQDAEASSDVMTLIVAQAINEITNDGSALVLSGLTISSKFKSLISATSSGSCDAEDLPNLSSSADSVVLNGNDFSCGNSVGSGSCTVRWNTGATVDDLTGIVDCDNLVAPTQGSGTSGACENIGVNGSIGFEANLSTAGSTTTYDITTLSAEDLTLSLESGHVCGVTSDLASVIAVDSTSGEGNTTSSGCLNVCGESFTISGTEDL
jgi:hypothetical protein